MTSRTSVPSELAVIGIDIGKEVFHLVGFDAEGKIVLRKKSGAWRWFRPSISCHGASSGWRPA